MEGVVDAGFRIESKASPVRIYEYGNFADCWRPVGVFCISNWCSGFQGWSILLGKWIVKSVGYRTTAVDQNIKRFPGRRGRKRFWRVVATATPHFFLHRGVNKKLFLRKCLFWDKKIPRYKKYITCNLVLNKIVTRKPMADFHNFFLCLAGNRIFRKHLKFFFEKSNKKKSKLLK